MIKEIYIKISLLIKKLLSEDNGDKFLFFAKGRLNIGDSMVPWLIANLVGIDYKYSNPKSSKARHLFSIGSILQLADKNCIVWGSGFISDESNFKRYPAEIIGVRGPRSAALIKSRWGRDVAVISDPALLTSSIIIREDTRSPIYKIGIIPHYIDKGLISDFIDVEGVRIINIETDNIANFVDEILQCEIILSSSLHGIIISESYGVPVRWIKLSDKIAGGDFKFHDYFESTGRFNIASKNLSIDELKNIDSHEPIDPCILGEIKKKLIHSFPTEFCHN